MDIPNTVVDCGGCGESLNLISPYLKVQVRAERQALVANAGVVNGDPFGGDENVMLGTKSGRGVIRKFHDFDCLAKWVAERKGKTPKLEAHVEDEIYEPEDNRSPEELVKAGELDKAYLSLPQGEATGGGDSK